MNKLYIHRGFLRLYIAPLFLCLLMMVPGRLFAVGWTPTDAGLVLNFEPGDQFLLSVVIDGKEYFVCDYPSYSSSTSQGAKFNYAAGDYLKLIPQSAGATTPSAASVWTVDTALTRISGKVNYSLGGISYTMWGNSGKTLYAAESPTKSSAFKFLGYLTNNQSHSDLCDVVFVVPTVRATTNMDPNNTLALDGTYNRGTGDKSWAFDGKMGVGFAGMLYREVYWFDIPRSNTPNAYTNASLVTFNRTTSNKTWNAGTISPGKAAYAFADSKHNPTTRTLFRIYPLNKPFSSCSSYFFGWDVQDYKKYRQSNTMTDSTSARKIYTLDHFACMEREGETAIFKSPDGQIQTYDSAYYYVGKNNKFYTSAAGIPLGSSTNPKSYSEFHSIRELRVRALKDASTTYAPGPGAYGCAVIDTTSGEANLGATFEPKGYFFQTSSGVNVPMRQTGANTWMSDQMWYIAGEYMDLEGRVMLLTDSVFSMTDPGAEIIGWSRWVKASDIPVAGTGGSSEGLYGWPRIYTNSPEPNGNIEFVEAEATKYIRYHNNGHFGVDIPDQHPEKGNSTVTVQNARLIEGYTFTKWTTNANGTGTEYLAGATVDLSTLTPVDGKYILDLYAQATYTGSINVAVSFVKDDGKRYFLTHPGEAPRFAHARTYTDWTEVRQGIGDANNSDPNYLTSYTILGHEGVCVECADDEYVWDPMYITMHGAKDSLVFYEDHQPNEDEYVGLFYANPNTIIANNTWSGLFKSSEGWPTPGNPCIEDTKLSSTHYLHRVAGVITRDERPNHAQSNIVYNPSGNQFDGTDAEGTDFMLSGVGVVDEHYIILPDTSDATTPWRNEITFDDHNEAQLEQVWSKLIGKHLLAQMKVGDDTIYFHPDRSKTFHTASELRLSNDYRLRHEFTFIPDSRAIFSEVDEANRASMEPTENDFCCNIYSGAATPIGPTQDIVDTLRVRLMPASTSKIKEYFGRWKKQSVDDGLTIAADGSRYRDILVKTKTYHYGAEQTNYILKPVLDLYSFGALAGQSQTLNFHVIRERYSVLYDSEGHEIRTEVLGRDTITTGWDLSSATCSLKSDAVFTIGTKTASSITLTTKAQNTEGDNLDTLTVTSTVTIDAVSHPITAKVPLMQTDLTGDELVWSAIHPTSGKRFFITIESGALAFRNFDLNNSRWQRNKQELKKGSKDANNTDRQYITPWKFNYNKDNASQLALKTEYDVNRYFKIFSETTPGVSEMNALDSALLTYEYVHVYTNDNGNIEEQVKLRYGSDKWLKFTGTALTLVDTKEEGTVFSWGYLSQEYQLLNNGTYPSLDSLVFGYNNGDSKSIQTCYKAYREYSMLVGNTLTYLCRENQTNLTTLTAADGDWRTNYTITRTADARTFDGGAKTSGLGDPVINTTNLTTTITPTPLPTTSPMNVTIGGKYVNIVDTLVVTLSLKDGAPTYRFKDWKNVNSLSDASLKIPLVRKTYHTAPYDSIICSVEGEEYNYAFPATLPKGVGVVESDSCHTFVLNTSHYTGTKTLDIDNNIIVYSAGDTVDLTSSMALNNINMAEIRLIDEYGKIPDWCEISTIGDHSVTVKCKKDGIRSPRLAYIYFAYIVTDENSQMQFVNYRLTISQASLFQYANNQTLTHSRGVTGDEKVNGMQQVHENKRVLYYYNPAPYAESDQDVELPVRERGFYGWWRWYREGKDELDFDVSDMDVLDSLWIAPPRNVGRYNFPYRIIGDSVMLKKKDGTDSIKILVQMGRYTVFHYPSRDYNTKVDPPAKSPLVMAPQNEKTLTYVVDISNYYDNLPLSLTSINQVDIAALDTMQEIIEPTLSLREIFELHPWTEMADTLDHYKSANALTYELKDEKYMEDHVVMAPTGNRLLLSTEQRYNYENLTKKSHSESLLGYYMHDDNWSSGGWDKARKDTMIWCGGWDADCEWFIYDPSSKTYTPCSYTVTESDDFLSVPAKGSTTGGAADTVYYCLRAQSRKSTHTGYTAAHVAAGEADVADPDPAEPAAGDYWFNICRYKVVYHNPNKYGPFQEKGTGKNAKAIITNDEIEQDYEVLERLNFDYIQPGSSYHVYPHPLPWKDASYGYSYPVGPEIPDNRYHNDFAPNFPGVGEYGLINRIPFANYWHKMEQHGGAENGYMIYCDGMSSSGQVAALSLSTHLCEGQKMYFSAYVGNPSNQKGKANPNFTFSVQGWDDEAKKWEDITTYMTGDIQPSDKWSQIFFPIEHEKAYDDFRVRIYNMASDFDGNDFIIDDMCVFATKPPLIAYQANTKCVEANENDSIIHVVLRVDYQGFTDRGYNKANVNYTVEQMTKDSVYSFVPMLDHYLSEDATHTGRIEDEVKVAPDTIFGAIYMPAHDFIPMHEDSIFSNLNALAAKFQTTYEVWDEWRKGGKVGPEPALFRQGYIYENLDGDIRPVLYIVHNAKMIASNKYTVRMSIGYTGLMSSQCAMTSDLKVTNRMMLMLNGEEQEEKEVSGMCANTIYEVGVRVRGTLIQDSVAPMPLTGTCSCDWLLYGDTAEASSLARYGYRFSDIEKVVRHVLRYEPGSGESNSNRFAKNIGEVNRNVMENIQKKCTLSTGLNAYDVLVDLVNKGFLSLYEKDVLVSVNSRDSVQYVVFPIVGTGTDDLQKQGMEVCPMPIVIKLKSRETDTGTPLIIGGLHRDSTQAKLPITVLADAENANKELAVPVDSIRTMIGIHAITLISTDDPNYREGVHKLNLTPGRVWPRDISRYYTKGDTIILTPASNNNYEMRPGYSYTFNIEMVSATDDPSDKDGCPIGNVPFIVSVVPDILRWAPADISNNSWNNPMNWIGVNANNEIVYENARFAPLATTDVIIPAMTEGMPYPELPNPGSISSADSVKEVGFVYNTCDDIRFLPGAAIGQQQRLTSDVTVVDMLIPQQKWAFRAAPVAGMLSGDLFMSDADLSGETKMWSVGPFDASGRSYKTGNATYWLSLYNTTTVTINANTPNDTTTNTSSAEWSKVTNGMTLPLQPAQGWAVYARTASGDEADIRLPKGDDIYYYYGSYGERLDNLYEDNLRALRATNAGESEAGKLAFAPGAEADHQNYTLTNAAASAFFVFGNPTMGYIDIWGFIADNGLTAEIAYLNAAGEYTTVTSETTGDDVITNPARYLPPMHAMIISKSPATTTLPITLNTNRIVTDPSLKVRAGAPRRTSPMTNGQSPIAKGIMTVTAINPVSNRCVSRLLIGQGYNDAIISGEDAVLTTLNINKFHMTNTPTTPFNIYAMEGAYGLSIDLRDSIVNVPLSFYLTRQNNLSFDPVTHLWFTGVNNLNGPLYLYDALTDTERPIIDGICLSIETPEANHEKRYYIHRRGFNPDGLTDPDTPTGFGTQEANGDQALKIIRNGQVLIIRNGHVYTIFGQQIR